VEQCYEPMEGGRGSFAESDLLDGVELVWTEHRNVLKYFGIGQGDLTPLLYGRGSGRKRGDQVPQSGRGCDILQELLEAHLIRYVDPGWQKT